MTIKRKVVRKIKRNGGNVLLALVIGLALGVLISSSLPNSSSSSSPKNTQMMSDSVNTNKIDGEYIYTNICMRCHITPTKYKSFTTYFGKPPSVWRIGVNKMISAGNVRLTPEEVEEIANYLSTQFGGRK